MYQGTLMQIIGIEPITVCFSDKCSTKWAKLAIKAFAVCAFMYWLLAWELNPVLQGYEPGDLTVCPASDILGIYYIKNFLKSQKIFYVSCGRRFCRRINCGRN